MKYNHMSDKCSPSQHKVCLKHYTDLDWELVSVVYVPHTNDLIMFFKKPAENGANEND